VYVWEDRFVRGLGGVSRRIERNDNNTLEFNSFTPFNSEVASIQAGVYARARDLPVFFRAMLTHH
jgi:hypothetical protein